MGKPEPTSPSSRADAFLRRRAAMSGSQVVPSLDLILSAPDVNDPGAGEGGGAGEEAADAAALRVAGSKRSGAVLAPDGAFATLTGAILRALML